MRYVHADSSVDVSRMLGRFAPQIILALVSRGESTEVKTTAELNEVIESIAGDKGTIHGRRCPGEEPGQTRRNRNRS